MALPRMIAALEDMPKQTTVPKLRTTVAAELAATILLLRCPRMMAYTLKANPQMISLAAAGTA